MLQEINIKHFFMKYDQQFKFDNIKYDIKKIKNTTDT